ncbi:MAG: hypothetical protein A2648_01105 [Candidatus Lloydbacteria bacterium RIFCSPHIGHO2_01_FULL_41_20]|uniref:Uncharacterized protein n=1 Tax=Candidatus Lloydbacteria bacterium RIFCSPHIGHO2_01_FULL_41_20 TaxID=1798657 RepID=A0A1G2CSW2_9BACT|nr:MAG: hypothetical protein A2648_01105 [Candidatus Lloydbacteria bacterium RIFCSPHIGHO2_01_FULL_41_20]
MFQFQQKSILIYFLPLFFLLFFIAPTSSFAIFGAPSPFGGPVVAIFPCFNNISAYRVILGPPSPGLYLYQTGVSRSFLFGPPIHPGQWVLGVSGGPPLCDISSEKGVFKAAKNVLGLIIFHGSSI